MSFALAGRRILLIDADLRSPSPDEVHGFTVSPGYRTCSRTCCPCIRPTCATHHYDEEFHGLRTGAPGCRTCSRTCCPCIRSSIDAR